MCNFACIGSKVVCRIFCCYTALDSITVYAKIFLTVKTDIGMRQGMSFCNKDLCTHKVNTCNHFCNGVLNLNTWVHFNKVVLTCLSINKKLNSTCINIVNVLCNFNSIRSESFDRLFGNRPSRSIFNNFLVAALERAVTLTEMHYITVLVSKNLNFNMLRLNKELFNKNILITKCLLSFIFNKLKLTAYIFLTVTAAHTASAAAGSSLENNGESIRNCFFNSFVGIFQRLCGAGDNGNVASDSSSFSGKLVTHLTENIGRRTDKLNAVCLTCACKVCIFG